MKKGQQYQSPFIDRIVRGEPTRSRKLATTIEADRERAERGGKSGSATAGRKKLIKMILGE